jgi:hypothetical protein
MIKGKPWVTRAEADGPYRIDEMLSLLATGTPGVCAQLTYGKTVCPLWMEAVRPTLVVARVARMGRVEPQPRRTSRGRA